MIKPIETYYNGFHFRSRAEARWAVFFDSAGIKYFYEPEGVLLSDGTMYLPDFYLPESKTFFEVKGLLSDIDMHKIEQLQKDLAASVAIGYPDMTFQSSDAWEESFSITDKVDSWFVQCRVCGMYYFLGATGSYICLNCGAYDGDHYLNLILRGDLCYDDSETFKPLINAKQARFEHGETPKIKESSE